MPSREARDLADLLLRKAEGDRAALGKLLDDPDVPDDVVGFHAQQAAEKALKATLASRGIRYERTHNLAYLLKLLGDNEISPPPDASGVEALTPWAAGFRYEDVAAGTLDRGGAAELVGGVCEWAAELLRSSG